MFVFFNNTPYWFKCLFISDQLFLHLSTFEGCKVVVMQLFKVFLAAQMANKQQFQAFGYISKVLLCILVDVASIIFIELSNLKYQRIVCRNCAPTLTQFDMPYYLLF